MKHLTPDELSAMLDGRLPPERALEAERHLDDCRACRQAFAAASAQDEALDRALAHDPGEAYFASFAGRVQMKIEGSGKVPSNSFLGGFREWFGVPRNLATAGAVGAVVIGVGTALIVAQQTNQEILKNERLAARMEQRGGASAPPPTDLNAPAPTAAQLKQKELDEVVEPGATLGLSEEAARQAREFRARDREGAAKAVSPDRAYEVRRSASGEIERVRPEGAQAPPAPTAPARADEGSPAGATTDNVKAALRAEPMSKSGSRELNFVAPAQLCGEVRDPSGRPLRFASVSLLSRNTGDQTDDHGRFCLKVRPGSDSLLVQLVGFEPLRTAVSLSSSPSQEVRLTLRPVRTLASSSRSATAVRGGRSSETQAMLRAPINELTLSSLPDSLRNVAELAQRLSTVAARSGDARQHEAAAGQWERLLVGVAGSSLEIPTRGRIAEQRYAAWEAAPDHKRAQAAREALTAYLVRAPIGPERNRATLWLDKVAK